MGEEKEREEKSVLVRTVISFLGILGMTLNWIWWWGSNSRAFGSVKYLYVVITPRSILLGFYLWVKSVWTLLVLDRNTWNHIIVYKWLLLRIITWIYCCSPITFLISYLKSYHCFRNKLSLALNNTTRIDLLLN